MFFGLENRIEIMESVLFEETFDNTELGQRGWYDGTACRIAEHSVRGKGCIEYEWVLNEQQVQGSSTQRHLFKAVDAVYIRFYLRLSKD